MPKLHKDNKKEMSGFRTSPFLKVRLAVHLSDFYRTDDQMRLILMNNEMNTQIRPLIILMNNRTRTTMMIGLTILEPSFITKPAPR